MPQIDRRHVIGLGLAAAAMSLVPRSSAAAASGQGTAYDFSFEKIEGGPLPLSQWRGRPILVVNTASQCGYTFQYSGLVKLWGRYRDKGLIVLGVPSNDFGGQEPGKAGEIKEFCETTFGVDFPLAAKTAVSGSAPHPFYRWAAEVLGPGRVPKWNFHKYLVGRDGHLLAAFPSATEPMSEPVLAAIDKALAAKPDA